MDTVKSAIINLITHLLQWGKIATASIPTDGKISYPVSFSSKMYSLLTHYNVTGSTATYGEQQDPSIGDEKTYFVAYRNSQTNLYLSWVAIGK